MRVRMCVELEKRAISDLWQTSKTKVFADSPVAKGVGKLGVVHTVGGVGSELLQFLCDKASCGVVHRELFSGVEKNGEYIAT